METEKRDINIGERIRNFRKQKGLSQHQVAEALAVSTSVISNLENNKSMVGVYTLLQILEVLDIGVEELLPEYSHVEDRELIGFRDVFDFFEGYTPDQTRDILNRMTGLAHSLMKEEGKERPGK